MPRTGCLTRVAVPGAVVGVIVLAVAGCATAQPSYVAADAPAAVVLSPSAAAVAATHRATAHWLSGASGDLAASGSYGRWRGSPIQIGGTWDNNDELQVQLRSICPGGSWARWDKPLDIAVGAIEESKGETWAAAAKGAYDARWRASFLRMKTCWGTRDPGLLYIRFAHEMNLSGLDWHVKAGEEADFVKAITRYSDLRYKILPKAKIVLCPSDGTDGRLGLDLTKLWPGKDSAGRLVANVYAVDTYNGYYVVHTAQEFSTKLDQNDQNGNALGLERHREFAQSMGVPFAVSEWSNNGDPKDAGKGGEEPDYVREMNEWFRENAGDLRHPVPGQLIYEIQFNLQPQFTFLPTKLQPKTAAAYRSLVWGS
jgi:hypothetical protein